MKKIFLTLITFLLIQSGFTQVSSPLKQQKMQWWEAARFGMFIHWGVYAVPAGVYEGHNVSLASEWMMMMAKIPVARYKEYAKDFNPIKYNAEEWVKMAKSAGMKYIVITTKHHDGFALFKTKANNWNVIEASPYGKDLIAPLAAACRKYKMKLGFYYSQAMDWGNAGGGSTYRPAQEGWPNPDSTRINAYAKAHEGHWDPIQLTKTFSEYTDDTVIPQLKEILSNYGDVAIIWFDVPHYGMTKQAAEKIQELLKRYPNIIINNRLGGGIPGDFKTPEQVIPKDSDKQYWETCMTMNGSWGYQSYNSNWKTTKTLVRQLIESASKGGNYLLNIGPKANGEFPKESIVLLQGIGKWTKVNGEAIYGTQMSPFKPFTWGRCTLKKRGKTDILYLSVFEWPKDKKLVIPEVKGKVINARILATGAKVTWEHKSGKLILHLPEKAPDVIASVIKVTLNGF
jgi:alpha-L-fucosidase